jgi:1-aminocyclopropane-1-carboxylate deaminase
MKDFYNNFNLWLPSPLQKINYSKYPGYDIYVKRDDLIHHDISGNKFRKLKYNLIEFYKTERKSIIAFGGAFSNLLYTLSVISAEMNIPATFYIRGEYDPDNPTLKFIKQNGVKMIFMSRSAFKNIRKQEFLDNLQLEFVDSYIIPEGGSNNYAVPGSGEIVEEIILELGEAPDYLVMDLGTGGTFAGVLANLPKKTKLVGIAAIKGVDWDRTLLKIFDGNDSFRKKPNWKILDNYHFGGFAKYNMELIDFINKYKRKYGIALDPVYTAKLVYALHDLLRKGFFKQDSKIVWVHGGGLQGIKGFNYLNGNLLI